MKEKIEQFSTKNPKVQSKNDLDYLSQIGKFYKNSLGTDLDKLHNFTKYVPRQTLSAFLVRDELFKKIINVHGYVIECGVFLGGGLLTFAQLSAIYEPYNHIRRIIGFDTFSGYPELTKRDKGKTAVPHIKKGGLSVNSHDDLQECVRLYDLNRPLGHIPRIELVKGNAIKTIPKYIKDNPHLVISLLYLDFNLYEATKLAIERFLPYMPKGSIIAFDELCFPTLPGETQAVVDTIGLSNLQIQRFSHNPHISYAVLD